MDKTIEGYLEASRPGPWRDALTAFRDAAAAHAALCERLMPDHEAYYDTPERMRGDLHPRFEESVRALERSVVARSAARDAMPAARDESFAAEASRLGSLPKVEGEPSWVRLLRDLHSLREWRTRHLDGIDVHLPPILVQRPDRDAKAPSMLERAVSAWAKAARIPAKATRDRIAELSGAGLIPGVSAVTPKGETLPYDVPARALAALAGREEPSALLAETEAAADVLPPECFPVPREAMEALAAMSGPAPR